MGEYKIGIENCGCGLYSPDQWVLAMTIPEVQIQVKKKREFLHQYNKLRCFTRAEILAWLLSLTALGIRSRWGSRIKRFTTWEKSTESIWWATVWDPETVWTTWRRQEALSWWESNYDSADFDGYLESYSKYAYLMKLALTQNIHSIKRLDVCQQNLTAASDSEVSV